MIADIIFYFVALVAGLFLLLVIAFPERFVPDTPHRKRKVGATYWGFYEGQPSEEPEEQRTIEAVAKKKKQKMVVGSQSYAAGRGVNLRGM